MSNNQNHQYELVPTEVQRLTLPGADIEFRPNFLELEQADTLFEQLLKETEWRQERITLFGETHATPRLSCWMGDKGRSYSYSNITMHPEPWSNCATLIKDKVESGLGVTFNSVLLNYYRNGQDSNGWHSDDEPELGYNPVIASLSLGAPRDFQLRHKFDKTQKQTLSLTHGSLLLMAGATQSKWQHAVPKRASAGPRINLTFRTIL